MEGTVDGCEIAFFHAYCDERGFRRTEFIGDGTGAFEITTTPGVTHPHYTCVTGTQLIVQQGGDGGTAVRDSCRQEVSCTDEYEGRVDADALDVVSDACRWLVVDGTEIRRRPRQPQPPPPSTTSPPPAPKAPSPPSPGPTGTGAPTPPPSGLPVPGRSPVATPSRPRATRSPLRSVHVRASRRRTVRVKVRVRSQVRATIRVEQRTRGRWRLAAKRTIAVRRAGTITRRLPGKGRLRPGRYRVRVLSTASRYPLVSSTFKVQ